MAVPTERLPFTQWITTISTAANVPQNTRSGVKCATNEEREKH